jgi:hypothetical protein
MFRTPDPPWLYTFGLAWLFGKAGVEKEFLIQNGKALWHIRITYMRSGPDNYTGIFG